MVTLVLGLAFALPVAAVAAGVVHADAARRGLPPASRHRWVGGVAVTSIGGFLSAFGADAALYRSYIVATGQPVVVTSPVELLAGTVVLGLVVSAAAVLAYGFGSRYGPLQST